MRSSDVLPHPLGPRSEPSFAGADDDIDAIEDRRVAAHETDRRGVRKAGTVGRESARRNGVSQRQLGRSRRDRGGFVMIVIQLKHIGYTRPVTWPRARHLIVITGAGLLLPSVAFGLAGARRPRRATTTPRRRPLPRSRRLATGPTPPRRPGPRPASSSTSSTSRSPSCRREYDELQAEVDELRSETEQVAVNRYMAAGAGAITIFEGPQASTDQIVANEFVATATNSSTTAMDEYAVAATDLEELREQLEDKQDELRGQARRLRRRAAGRRGRGRATSRRSRRSASRTSGCNASSPPSAPRRCASNRQQPRPPRRRPPPRRSSSRSSAAGPATPPAPAPSRRRTGRSCPPRRHHRRATVAVAAAAAAARSRRHSRRTTRSRSR